MSFLGWARTTMFGLGEKDMAAVTRHFKDAEPSVRARLDDVCAAFQTGFNAAMAVDGVPELIEALERVDRDARGWAYEGAGMGVGIRVMITPGSTMYADYLRAADPHHYLVQVGAGWAIGKVPVRHGALWAQAEGVFHWLAWDGLGFHDAIFHTERAVERREGRPTTGGYEGHAYDQGVGRALWFVEAARPERVAARIQTFEASRHADLWGGVGLAACYANGAGDETLAELARLSGPFRPQLGVGATLAVCARVRADNLGDQAMRACRVITGSDAREVNAVLDEIMDALPDNAEKYGQTRERLARRLEERAARVA